MLPAYTPCPLSSMLPAYAPCPLSPTRPAYARDQSSAYRQNLLSGYLPSPYALPGTDAGCYGPCAYSPPACY
eukprot:1515423-Rhodomonas_salina.1